MLEPIEPSWCLPECAPRVPSASHPGSPELHLYVLLLFLVIWLCPSLQTSLCVCTDWCLHQDPLVYVGTFGFLPASPSSLAFCYANPGPSRSPELQLVSLTLSTHFLHICSPHTSCKAAPGKWPRGSVHLPCGIIVMLLPNI